MHSVPMSLFAGLPRHDRHRRRRYQGVRAEIQFRGDGQIHRCRRRALCGSTGEAEHPCAARRDLVFARARVTKERRSARRRMSSATRRGDIRGSDRRAGHGAGADQVGGLRSGLAPRLLRLVRAAAAGGASGAVCARCNATCRLPPRVPGGGGRRSAAGRGIHDEGSLPSVRRAPAARGARTGALITGIPAERRPHRSRA